MLEKIGHVKNPLTVIAIFAGIAEISGTLVLPFIEKDNQELYIWFLMLFPFFLVGAFFLTLNFNHRTLYSPSDYKNEQNFIDAMVKVSAEERRDKLRMEVKEVEAELKEEQSQGGQPEAPGDDKEQSAQPDLHLVQETSPPYQVKSADTLHAKAAETDAKVLSEVALAEKLALMQMSKYLGTQLKTDIRFDFDGTPSVEYDAVGLKLNQVDAIEIKYVTSAHPRASRFYDLLSRSAAVSRRIEKANILKFKLHLYLVTNASQNTLDELTAELFTYAKILGLDLEVHTRSLASLASEYQYG